LKKYTKLPPTEEMTEVVVNIMVHVLHILAYLTAALEQGELSKSVCMICPLSI
jgi:hypothetical protein